jgi:nucleoside-diphosphate-sugar epimerase
MNLISGASGFIGQRLLASLSSENIPCRVLSRTPIPSEIGVTADLADKAALLAACTGVETVFHCAGYAHAFTSLSADDTAMHWKVNFEGTQNLVDAAGRAGVKKFVFLSSVKAMAEPGNMCATESLLGDPDTAYGESKLAAEKAVLTAGRVYGMHVVNLRLAMVYGAGGRGNLERMGRLVKRRLFPPLPDTGNHRSLVHVDDVIAAIRLVADDHRATGKTYIIASPEAPSGRALFDALRVSQGLPRCTWSVPVSLLRFVANIGDGLEKLLKRRSPLNTEVLNRLLNSAWYSPAYIQDDLGWHAKVSLNDGLTEMLGK